MTSAIFFNVFMDRLIKNLRKEDFGCHVLGEFVGVFIYADDIFLLSPSRPGLQAMVDNCSKFAKENSLKFSTNPNPKLSKTKCIIFSKNANDRVNVTPIILNGDPLPWVPEVLHLGHHLECDGSMKLDIAMKRGRFIGKVTSLKQEFNFVTPEVKMNLFNIYTKSFYGFNLWNINSKECHRLYSNWNIAVGKCFQISWQTHCYLIEKIMKNPFKITG